MENFYSAASRHWDNSAFLSDHNRHQEAAYLAGYAIDYNPNLININRLSQVVASLTDLNGDYAQLVQTIGTFLGRDTI